MRKKNDCVFWGSYLKVLGTLTTCDSIISKAQITYKTRSVRKCRTLKKKKTLLLSEDGQPLFSSLPLPSLYVSRLSIHTARYNAANWRWKGEDTVGGTWFHVGRDTVQRGARYDFCIRFEASLPYNRFKPFFPPLLSGKFNTTSQRSDGTSPRSVRIKASSRLSSTTNSEM